MSATVARPIESQQPWSTLVNSQAQSSPKRKPVPRIETTTVPDLPPSHPFANPISSRSVTRLDSPSSNTSSPTHGAFPREGAQTPPRVGPPPPRRQPSIRSTSLRADLAGVSIGSSLNPTPEASPLPSPGISTEKALPPRPKAVTSFSQPVTRSVSQSSVGMQSALAMGAEGSIGLDEVDDGLEFSVDRLPTSANVNEACSTFLRDEDGNLVLFGDLLPQRGTISAKPPRTFTASDVYFSETNPSPEKPENPTANVPPPKTVAFFIRHLWCGMCQDYTLQSICLLDPKVLEAANIRVVIISVSSYKLIKAYRELFKCPFPIYVDGSRKLYKLLGMTRNLGESRGPMFNGRAAYHRSSVPKQLFRGATTGITKMPWASIGSIKQLGGEFIFDSGPECTFAHRMKDSSDHLEAYDVVKEAGCDAPTLEDSARIELDEAQLAEAERLAREEAEWRQQRDIQLETIQRRKLHRRENSSSSVPQISESGSRSPAYSPNLPNRSGLIVQTEQGEGEEDLTEQDQDIKGP